MRKILMLCAAAAFATGVVSAASAQTKTPSAPTTGSTSASGSASGSATIEAAPGRLGADADDSTSVRSAGASTSRTTPEPGASAEAPGQRATDSASAKTFAPGQEKKKKKGDTSASDLAPGHEVQSSGSSDVNGGAATSR